MDMKILQLKDLEKYGFMSYEFACKHGFDLKDYKCVYEENIDSDTSLEDIFIRFNTDHPASYTGHSLSVSDIVSLDGQMFYCDSCGWEEIK